MSKSTGPGRPVRGLLPLLFAVLTFAFPAYADSTYRVASNSDLVGAVGVITAVYEDTLLDIARQNGLGFNEIKDANPGMDPWIPGAGSLVIVPSAWILPEAPREGIVLNLAEMRLFRYFDDGGGLSVETYPIGVGQEGSDTPLGVYKITEKEKDPVWIVPKSIREEKPELPAEVPPGPDNPLGDYKMRLGYTTFLIHGTNRPWGVGRRVSHGCIRLYPEDIERLFGNVAIGEQVRIVYQPVKLGMIGSRLVVEVHHDYLTGESHFSDTLSEIIRRGLLDMTDVDKLNSATLRQNGLPTDITKEPAEVKAAKTDENEGGTRQ